MQLAVGTRRDQQLRTRVERQALDRAVEHLLFVYQLAGGGVEHRHLAGGVADGETAAARLDPDRRQRRTAGKIEHPHPRQLPLTFRRTRREPLRNQPISLREDDRDAAGQIARILNAGAGRPGFHQRRQLRSVELVEADLAGFALDQVQPAQQRLQQHQIGVDGRRKRDDVTLGHRRIAHQRGGFLVGLEVNRAGAVGTDQHQHVALVTRRQRPRRYGHERKRRFAHREFEARRDQALVVRIGHQIAVAEHQHRAVAERGRELSALRRHIDDADNAAITDRQAQLLTRGAGEQIEEVHFAGLGNPHADFALLFGGNEKRLAGVPRHGEFLARLEMRAREQRRHFRQQIDEDQQQRGDDTEAADEDHVPRQAVTDITRLKARPASRDGLGQGVN